MTLNTLRLIRRRRIKPRSVSEAQAAATPPSNDNRELWRALPVPPPPLEHHRTGIAIAAFDSAELPRPHMFSA